MNRIPIAWWRALRERLSEGPLRAVHAHELVHLPPHHGHPFDRMLIAQARIEDLRLMTIDPKIRLYDLPLFD